MSKSENFKELSTAKIQPSRNLVISFNQNTKDFTLAQQLIVKEGFRQTAIFMKNSIHVSDLEGLYSIRDALNEAIKSYEDSNT